MVEYIGAHWLTPDEDKKVNSLEEKLDKLRNNDKPWYIKNALIDHLENEIHEIEEKGNLRIPRPSFH